MLTMLLVVAESPDVATGATCSRSFEPTCKPGFVWYKQGGRTFNKELSRQKNLLKTLENNVHYDSS